MGAIKEFYHEEICKANETELQKAINNDAEYWRITEEDAQIMKRAEEMEHSEMPNFLR